MTSTKWYSDDAAHGTKNKGDKMDPAIREAAFLIRQIYRIVDRLEAIFPGRHFTPDGHLVGSIGEVLAAARYDLKLLPASARLHDARTRDNKLVQVKATQSDRIAFRGAEAPSHLIVLSLNRNGTATEEYNGPGDVPWASASKLQSNGQRPLSLRSLRNLMGATDVSQRIPEVPFDSVTTNPNLSQPDVEGIISDMVERCAALVSKGRRGELLNERFFHHMFSWEVGRWYSERGQDVWDHLLLAPEHPTSEKFRRACINLADEASIFESAIGNGRSGNLDFAIKSSPAILVEWKGPDMWTQQDIVEVLLKLLTEPASTIKVFAGILASSTTGKYGHVGFARTYFLDAIECVKRILQVTSLVDLNLYAYLATLPDDGPVRIHWGRVEEDPTDVNRTDSDTSMTDEPLL